MLGSAVWKKENHGRGTLWVENFKQSGKNDWQRGKHGNSS